MDNAVTDDAELLASLRAINALAAFNRWAGFEVVRASPGEADLRMAWRGDIGQYANFLHAGLIGALIDTACGFAAATLVKNVLASHFAVDCLSPAIGEAFVAQGRVVKAGRKQIFATANLLAEKSGATKLVATGSAIMVPVAG
jgi:uncharacterized protein (TIGR00369 family)